jgi:small subunit ribosomal protein S16
MFQIVAADSRVARNGKFLEIIGRYEPVQHPMVITTKDDRVFHWLKNGALPTDTVRSLLQRTGLWFKWSMMKRGMDQTAIATEMEKWQMAQAGKRQVEEARKARRKATRKRKKSGEASAPAAEPAPAITPAQA